MVTQPRWSIRAAATAYFLRVKSLGVVLFQAAVRAAGSGSWRRRLARRRMEMLDR